MQCASQPGPDRTFLRFPSLYPCPDLIFFRFPEGIPIFTALLTFSSCPPTINSVPLFFYGCVLFWVFHFHEAQGIFPCKKLMAPPTKLVIWSLRPYLPSCPWPRPPSGRVRFNGTDHLSQWFVFSETSKGLRGKSGHRDLLKWEEFNKGWMAIDCKWAKPL